MTRGKRVMDLSLSLLGLALLAPILLFIAIVVVLADGRPVLFRQTRVGLAGREFDVLKFRSMRAAPASEVSGFTVAGDPRITTVGRFLRKSKLDELPQLWNVVKGEMSLVGPRPEVSRFVALYDARQRRVLMLVPGVTDPASIAYRNEELLLAGAEDPEAYYVGHIMPAKIELNLEYAATSNVLTDLLVIGRTLRCLWHRA